jgi:UDP-GlcNAc:undecaprenyl-phosphate/decaprenyl-phosphate GlcNAc-1-phosphate transferase
MVLLGILDDIRDINAKLKLLIQSITALVVVLFGMRITLFIESAFIGGVITVIWIVAITNAFNLLDNMDGLSAGTAFISSIIFFFTAWVHGYLFVSAIMLVFAGSIAGFLRYNVNPAKIFMGDAGSLFIGFMLSSLTILNTYYAEGSKTLFPVIMPVLILAVPIFDMLSVIVIRIKNRESIFKPDKRHFSHRLVALGLTHRQAVSLVYLICFCVGISSLLLRQVNAMGAFIIIVQALAIFGIIISLESAGAKNKGRLEIFGKEKER